MEGVQFKQNSISRSPFFHFQYSIFIDSWMLFQLLLSNMVQPFQKTNRNSFLYSEKIIRAIRLSFVFLCREGQGGLCTVCRCAQHTKRTNYKDAVLFYHIWNETMRGKTKVEDDLNKNTCKRLFNWIQKTFATTSDEHSLQVHDKTFFVLEFELSILCLLQPLPRGNFKRQRT